MGASIIIYAGAIIVTFLFVLMLASQAGISGADARSREPLMATAVGFLLLGCLIYVLQMSYEKTEVVHVIDYLIAKTEEERASLTKGSLDRDKFRAFPESLVTDVKDEIEAGKKKNPPADAEIHELEIVKGVITAIQSSVEDWPEAQTANLEDMEKAYTRLGEALVHVRARIRNQHGFLPALPVSGIASNLSGPPAVEPNGGWRYDTEERPNLPADNAAYLGRSLFTDFLLPVELGGVLLLVAVIGAIAIAQRRTDPHQASGGGL
jgi:NADH:ubiquinone oxidoreductase subunit 6 (subunit J)